MRTGMRLVALAILVAVLALWFFGGMNRGWTQTTVAVDRVDEVTDQKYKTWEKRFLPGIEFLAGGIVVSGTLVLLSFLFAKK